MQSRRFDSPQEARDSRGYSSCNNIALLSLSRELVKLSSQRRFPIVSFEIGPMTVVTTWYSQNITEFLTMGGIGVCSWWQQVSLLQ